MKINKFKIKTILVMVLTISALVSGCSSPDNSKPSGDGSAVAASNAAPLPCLDESINRMEQWVKAYREVRQESPQPKYTYDFQNIEQSMSYRVDPSFYEGENIADSQVDACCVDARFSSTAFCSERASLAADPLEIVAVDGQQTQEASSSSEPK